MKLTAKILSANLCLGLFAAGCSPYAYTKEIESFANSTKAFSAGIDQITADIVAKPSEKAFWVAYGNPTVPTLLDPQTCSAPNPKPTQRCSLRANGENHRLTPTDLQLLASLKNLNAFSKYAAALSAVSNADDRAAFDAAAGRLASSAATFTGGLGPSAGAITGPVVEATFAIQGIALDQARLRQLQRSVASVDAKLPAASKRLATALSDLKAKRVKAAYDQHLSVQLALPVAVTNSERAEIIRELQKGANEISNLQAQDPKKLVDAMVSAHSALAKALKDPRVNLADVAKELSNFAEIANAFKAALSVE